MNTDAIREVFDEQLTTQFHEPQDLGSIVVAKLIARQRRQAIYKAVYLVLALALVILVVAFSISPQLRTTAIGAFLQTTGIGNQVVQSVVVEEGSSGPNASIWSSEPALAQFPDQEFHGRLVVEVWTQGEFIFYPSDEGGDPHTPQFFDRILATLREPQTEILTSTPWTNEPVMGEVPDQSFIGRVVVEVWDEQIVVAAAGSESPAVLVQRGIATIEQHSANTNGS